ncbi:hypothetical protein D3C77_526170 [compost metagenome]
MRPITEPVEHQQQGHAIPGVGQLTGPLLALDQLFHPLDHQRALLQPPLGMQALRSEWRTAGQRQQVAADVRRHLGQCLTQPGQALRIARQRAGLLHATALDGRQQAAGQVTDQQHHGIAGRFLQALEQRVGGIQVHRFRRLQQQHLAAAELCRLHHEIHQLAHLIDPDRLVGFLRFENEIIRVGTGGQQVAGLALPAGLAVNGLPA